MLKSFIKKYSHGVLLVYFLFYMPYFSFLNVYTPQRANAAVISCPLDNIIPFWEIFAIPYFLWFAYIAAGYVFLMFSSKSDFVRMCIFLYSGMTISLIIYTLFPNCQQLRVNYAELGRQNILTEAMRYVQSIDTPYNVFPSIHCLNSIGMHIALSKSETFKKHRLLVIASFILTILIILSTVFVKQHSVLDIIGAVALSVPLYFLAYRTKLSFLKDVKAN